MADEIQEKQTPQYEYNDELYNLSDLRNAARENFESYINTHPSAHKLLYDIWSAVNQLINGLQLDRNGNSRVYYDTSRGLFVDSYGEYRNTVKHRNRTDVYGYAVGFLNTIIGKSGKIQKETPQEKPKLTQNAIDYAISSKLAGDPIGYNGDFRPYINAFIELDEKDEQGNRSNINRSQLLKAAITLVKDNFDSIFKDYDVSEEDKSKWISAATDAINVLDNGLSRAELMVFSRVSPTLLNLLLTEEAPPVVKTQEEIAAEEKARLEAEEKARIEAEKAADAEFEEYLNFTYDVNNYKTKLHTIKLSELDQAEARNICNKLMAERPSFDQVRVNFWSENDSTWKGFFGSTNLAAILLAMFIYLGNTEIFGDDHIDYSVKNNLFVLPGGHTGKYMEYGITYDPKTGIMRVGDINVKNLNKWRKARRYEFDSKSETFPYFKAYKTHKENLAKTAKHKHGGILKASKGSILKGEEDLDFGKINYDDDNLNWQEILENVSWDLNTRYAHTKGENGGIALTERDSSYKSSPSADNVHYAPEEVSGSDIEAQAWWKRWLLAARYNEDLAKAFAVGYRQHSGNKSVYTNWFDDKTDEADGNANGEFNYAAFLHDMYDDDGTPIVDKVWNDAASGHGHDIYKGKVYVYQDEDGNVHYTNNTDGWTVGNTDIMHGKGPIAVYQLTKQSPENSEDNSSDEGTPDDDEEGKRAVDFLEDGIGPWSGKLHKDHNKWGKGIDWNNLSSLPINIAGNRRVYDTAKEGIKPALQAAPYAWNRVYGNYPAVLLANQLAALLNYQTWRRSGADQAFNMAAYLSANEKGNAAVNQAQQLDYAQITSTLDRNLQTQNQNNQQRVATANANMAAINKANKEKADLKAQYLRTFYDSLENAINDRKDEYKENKDTIRALAYNQYAALLQKEMDAKLAPYQAQYAEWKAAHPGSLMSDWEHYAEYKKLQKELGYAMSSALNNFQAQLYGYNFRNLDYSTTHVFDNVALPTWKRGGKLILRRMKR